MCSDTLNYIPPTHNIVVGQVGKSSIRWAVESEASTGDVKLSYLECEGR